MELIEDYSFARARRSVLLPTLSGIAFLGWACVAAKFFNRFVAHHEFHIGRSSDARIQAWGVCVTHADVITGHYLNCQEARTLARARFSTVYALEHACKDLFVDTIRGLTSELGPAIRLFGILATTVFTSAAALSIVWGGRRQEKTYVTYAAPTSKDWGEM